MAHEIKNPLTPILLSAQRLRNKFLDTLKGRDLEIIDKTTNVIIDQVKSMDAMVSAFADYANTPQIERKPADLNALINQSIALYDAQSNISIEFDLAGDVPELLLDANSISRVLINLVKNSAESVEDGRDLTVSVTTQYLPSEGVVRLSITDNGDGLLALHPFRERYQYVYVRDDGRDDGARSRRQGGRLWRRGLRRLPDQIAR
jgi:nitrogen fixation/metabolism regulation signal transduction histidine kinase